jgi:flagellar motor switch protein FliG
MVNEEKELKKKDTDVASKLLRGSLIKDFEMSQLTGQSRLNVLDGISPEALALLIRGDSLSVQAILLAHIDARKSFQTLEALPVSLRSQILHAISKLEPVSPSLLDEWNLRLRERLKEQNGPHTDTTAG